ncbi:DUF4330 domain-containing protein [Halorientalis regularis]|uniref:DUF4330 domain-containing protein n=1 Tax=Halorientalis regularis TaxID=660518 RepID=A0A1G7LB30_9EURY|nr:DUF4330 domain-containing protein [Halorientalis regularis]SDF46762.1 protein of unknown function [Halorientalis regularis]
MELIDEEGRLFGRVNVVDALVVLVVLAVVAAGVALVTGGGGPLGSDGTSEDVETRYATLALGQQPASSASNIEVGQNVTLAGSSATMNVTDVFLTGASNGQVRVFARVAYPNGTVVGSGPIRAGRSVTIVGDDYQTDAAVQSVNDSRSMFRTERTPVSVTTTVESEVATAVNAGDRLTVGDHTLATVESVASLPTNESGLRRLHLGVTLATRTVDGEPKFADRTLRIGTAIPLRTNGVEGLNGTIETVGSVEPAGDPTNVTMTVAWEGVRSEVAEAVTEGLEERHPGATARIVDVTAGPAQVVVPTDSGELVVSEHPGERDVTLTVEATARQTGSELGFHGRPLSEGRTVTLEFDTVTLQGTVLDFEANE